VIRAFLFALDPTDAQAEAFRSHCGAQRFAYNWGLALVRANVEQRAAERTYGIGEDQLTEPVDWSAFSLRRAWNEAKDVRARRGGRRTARRRTRPGWPTSPPRCPTGRPRAPGAVLVPGLGSPGSRAAAGG
jgi:hypothetical protein